MDMFAIIIINFLKALSKSRPKAKAYCTLVISSGMCQALHAEHLNLSHALLSSQNHIVQVVHINFIHY